MNIQLGNESPIGAHGNRITSVRVADDTTLIDVLHIIGDAGGVWANHSTDKSPAWIECDNTTVQDLLRANYKVGDRPADWEETVDDPTIVESGGTA